MKIFLQTLGFGLVLLAAVTLIESQKMVGGIGDDKAPDSNVQEVVDSVQDSIKSAALTSLTASGANADPNAFTQSPIEVLSYKTQVVAGINYFAKIRIATYIFHARIYKHFSGTSQVTKVIGPKQESDPIAYFQ